MMMMMMMMIGKDHKTPHPCNKAPRMGGCDRVGDRFRKKKGETSEGARGKLINRNTQDQHTIINPVVGQAYVYRREFA